MQVTVFFIAYTKKSTILSLRVIIIRSVRVVCKLHRGYYMAAQRYEISLRVLKNISLVRYAHS